MQLSLLGSLFAAGWFWLGHCTVQPSDENVMLRVKKHLQTGLIEDFRLEVCGLSEQDESISSAPLLLSIFNNVQ